jgi:hypothetical protein
MAEPELEAAWRAELKRIGETLVQRAAARSLSLETFGPHRMTARAQANGV